ncbi:hypothetical protein EMCRGX_G008619 [Ephydatia muelleri]
MMGGFRLQMAHELSCGVLYALQSDVHHLPPPYDDVGECLAALEPQFDMDDEDDADESDEERTADPNFFVPTYENEPDPNDIFGLKWDRFSTCFPVNSEPSKGVGDISLSHGDESDVKFTASVCTSRINKIIVWLENKCEISDTMKIFSCTA